MGHALMDGAFFPPSSSLLLIVHRVYVCTVPYRCVLTIGILSSRGIGYTHTHTLQAASSSPHTTPQLANMHRRSNVVDADVKNALTNRLLSSRRWWKEQQQQTKMTDIVW
jgi:hypothetical protein